MKSVIVSVDLLVAKADAEGALTVLHSAFTDDAGVRDKSGKSNLVAYNESTAKLAQFVCDNIMMALAGPESTHLFETVMLTSIKKTLEASKNGKVCPCCSEPWDVAHN